jgi:proteasome lid subunit RPN8/RPN11
MILLSPLDDARTYGAVVVVVASTMMKNTLSVQLILSAAQEAALKAAAESAAPRECCGLLVGHGRERVTVTEVVAAANIAEDAARRFMIDPQVQFDVMRRLRGSEERIVGHYHSHPNGNTTLSAHDLAMADDPGAIWVVVALDIRGKAGTPAAFVCRDGKAETAEIVR